MPLHPNLLTYDLNSLDWAASCMQTFLELRGRTVWMHVIVRSVAFRSFLEAMDADQGRTRTLIFSCWCDGGKYEEARHRQHRHMIVVAPSERHFLQNVWKKVKIAREDRPGPNFRIIHKEPIETPMHLVQALGYVSKRESICKFSGESAQINNHYYIFQSLPKDFKLPLVMQFVGGLRRLLDRKFFNMKWAELVRATMQRPGTKWEILVKNIPGITLGTVLPVTQDLKPCSEQTALFLHLLKGKKLYFERSADPSGATSAPWSLEQQARGGNAFYDVVGEEAWTPRPFHQRLINEFRPLVVRIEELEAQLARLEAENARLEAQLADSRGDSERWKRRLAEKERTSEKKIRGLAEKNGALAFRISRLARTERSSQKKIQGLTEKMLQLNEGEVARLKAELEKMEEVGRKKDEEIEQLRRQKDEEIEQVGRQKDEEMEQVRRQKDAEIEQVRREMEEVRRGRS